MRFAPCRLSPSMIAASRLAFVSVAPVKVAPAASMSSTELKLAETGVLCAVCYQAASLLTEGTCLRGVRLVVPKTRLRTR